MRLDEIKYIEKHFQKYTETNIGKLYIHNEESFSIVITENNEVYQLNSEHEIQGIELETLDKLHLRFKSFTGSYFTF